MTRQVAALIPPPGSNPETAYAWFGFMAGTDTDRLADMNDALRDPGVRAIITTRGGAGANE